MRTFLENERSAVRSGLRNEVDEVARVVRIAARVDSEYGDREACEDIAVIEQALRPDRPQHNVEGRLECDRVDPVDHVGHGMQERERVLVLRPTTCNCFDGVVELLGGHTPWKIVGSCEADRAVDECEAGYPGPPRAQYLSRHRTAHRPADETDVL